MIELNRPTWLDANGQVKQAATNDGTIPRWYVRAVNLRSLDPNKWYPVFSNGISVLLPSRFMIIANDRVPWGSNNASGGVGLFWTSFYEEVTGNGWGAIPVRRIIYQWGHAAVTDDKPPIGGVGQLTYNNRECFWLRGGPLYEIYYSNTEGTDVGEYQVVTVRTNMFSNDYPWWVEPATSPPSTPAMSF